jgi:hypothetical protein
MKDLPVRKPNRLKDYNYGGNGAYFITICVKDRHEMLGKIVGAAIVSRGTWFTVCVETWFTVMQTS